MKINILKIKNIVKPEMIVIMQGNIDKLRIPYTIKNIVFLKKSLQVFVMDLTVIVILLQKGQEKNLKNCLLVLEKIKKKNPLQFQQEKKLQELIKMEKK